MAFVSRSSNLVPGDTTPTGNTSGDVFVRDLATGTTRRVSINSDEAQANSGNSSGPSVSAGGRYVAFASEASNLVPGDTNGIVDVFVRDRKAGITRRVSVSSRGTQGNSYSYGSTAISARGRFVAFYSDATNLVRGDTNDVGDVFVRNLKNRTTRRVSVRSNEAQSNAVSHQFALSGNGRFVAFSSQATNLVRGDTNPWDDVFVRDRKRGITRRMSVRSDEAQANGDSYEVTISGSGRYVAFRTWASNLVRGDTNGWYDVLVRDRKRGTTRRVSVSTSGAQGNGSSEQPAISRTGRFVAFTSSATNLVLGDSNGRNDVFVRVGPR